jgi:hypothetical protein
MAKISARGATKVAEFRSDAVIYVVCSDGRLLRRFADRTLGAGYNLVGKSTVDVLIQKLEGRTGLKRTV